MSEFEKPAVIDEATWPTHAHGAEQHRHNGAVEGHTHGMHSEDARALDRCTELLGEALKSEFGHFLSAEDEQWRIVALGVLTKMRGTITSGDDGLVILTLQ